MLPSFNIYNVLPPIRPGQKGHSSERSPYQIDILPFCQRFCLNPSRRSILFGFLELREILRSEELTGFQWINGSFTEDIEVSENRWPNDIDVVTFTALGSREDQKRLFTSRPELFFDKAKTQFSVDHYLVSTDVPRDAHFARQISYWYSMWSHRRIDSRWKGFVSINLTLENDAEAKSWLQQWNPGGS